MEPTPKAPRILPLVRAGLKGGGGLDTDHERLNETNGYLGSLPTNGCSLIERVGGACATELLDDMLKSAAGNVGNTVGIVTDNESRVNVDATGTPTGEYLRLGRFNESDARNLTYLTVVDEFSNRYSLKLGKKRGIVFIDVIYAYYFNIGDNGLE